MLARNDGLRPLVAPHGNILGILDAVPAFAVRNRAGGRDANEQLACPVVTRAGKGRCRNGRLGGAGFTRAGSGQGLKPCKRDMRFAFRWNGFARKPGHERK